MIVFRFIGIIVCSTVGQLLYRSHVRFIFVVTNQGVGPLQGEAKLFLRSFVCNPWHFLSQS